MKGGDLSKVSTLGLQMMRQMQAHESAAADTAAWAAHINPTDGMSGMDKFNAGAGKAFSDIGTGIGQRLGLVSREDVKEQRNRDAPLMKTGAGLTGNLMGNLTLMAPASLLPGAQAVPGAAAIGATIGYLQPSASLKEDAINTGLGAAAGAGGQWIANKAAGSVAFQEAQNAAKAAQGAQKAQAAKSAQEAGYVIPPEDLGQGGGLITKLLSGAGGKIKTAQVASERNQSATNDLVKQALGIPADTPLTAETLKAVRDKAGQAYDAVRSAGTVTADPAYMKAMDAIGANVQKAAQQFPGAFKSDVPELVQSLKQPTFSADSAVDAIKLLRGDADVAYRAGDADKGRALKSAAQAMEDMLGRHLKDAGNPDALQAFNQARETIAKTYSAQKGLNTTTGDVAAKALATQLEKGKPLSGELLTVAQAAQAFPKATQALKEAPKTFSPLDMAVSAVRGDPLGLLTLGARPAARSILLSKPMQNAAVDAAQTPEPANALLRLLSNQDAALPLSITGGNALARQLQR
jgi:hypothetical protein